MLILDEVKGGAAAEGTAKASSTGATAGTTATPTPAAAAAAAAPEPEPAKVSFARVSGKRARLCCVLLVCVLEHLV